MNKISMAIGVATLLMYGCSDKPKDQKSSSKTEKTQTVNEVVAKAPTDTSVVLETPHVGVLLETIDSGGYTYARVDEAGNIYWIAGPTSALTIGSKVSYIEQMIMVDFTSKSLKRKFDSLMFVSAIVPTDKSGKPIVQATKEHTGNAHAANNTTTAHANATKAVADTVIKVAKNANGYNIDELYAKKDSLKDKTIKVDAQVVKVSKGIMGKDWVHLQDGSGSAGTNDIIATAKGSTVTVGDKVTTDGVIKTNIDLGYGYKFSVIIEEAKFTPIK
jgi:hypothetical protein